MPKKAKTKSKLTERQLKYWMTKNCPRNHCWIIVARIGEIVSHPERQCYFEGNLVPEINLNQNTFQYVYFAEFNESKSLLTLVQDDKFYYVIRNQNSEDTVDRKDSQDDGINANTTASKSEINVFKTFMEAVNNGLTNTERKKFGIKNAELSKTEQKALTGIVSIDFINKTSSQQKHLWCDFVGQQTNSILDLSGFFILDPEDMSTRPNENVDTLILYQNNKITNFEWFKHFPKLKNISIWFCNTLQDHHIDGLVDNAQHVTSIQLHHCYQVSGRCLKPFSKLALLNELFIDNPQMSCQPDTYRTVLSRDEWKEMSNDSLQTLFINSDNLTVDFTYYITKTFNVLKRIVVSHYLLDKLHKSTVDGFENEQLIFQSCLNYKAGFKRLKEVKFMNLLKDKVRSDPYSDSMLKIIKDRSKQYAGIADEMIKNKTEVLE